MRISLKIGRDKFEFHKWYAWHPVVIDGSLVWLETVERRLVSYKTYHLPFDETYTRWDYRAIDKEETR